MSANRPAWSYPEERAPGTKPSVQSGLRSVGTARAYCYGCRGDHPFSEPCPAKVKAAPPEMAECSNCHAPFRLSPSHKVYCTSACRDEARVARRKAQT